MRRIDRILEKMTRQTAKRTSRRGFLGKLGAATVVAGAPLLPIARSSGAAPVKPQPTEMGDPQSCDYWRYCAIDGYLCSCCGGSTSSCPPGTERSPITWVGTCRNPADGRDYIISYNDCCGKSSCGRCQCARNERDTPAYAPSTSNDLDWCLGTSSGVVYNCSLAVVLGAAS